MNSTPSSNPLWKWGVCGLLLLATMINYMDRMTLNQVAKRVKVEFAENDNQLYARLETAFGLAFATGSVLSGLIVDRTGVRYFYPLMVLLWSAAGFATGFVRNYDQLLLCRFLLGICEGANWPCALYTTQKILPAAQRTMGNGILQSGAALGAIATPQIVRPFLDEHSDIWRYPFMIVGAIGLFWVIGWLFVIRSHSVPSVPAAGHAGGGHSMWDVFADRRFWVLACVVIAINATWHFFRVWLPLLMQELHHYTPTQVADFTTGYYVATDLGSLTAGFLTLALVRRGLGVHTSRLATYLLCALLALMTFAAANLPKGPLLIIALMIVGFGSLGVFPTYYSFTQELSARHQGKVSGTLGCICWLALAGLKELEGFATKEFGYIPCIAAAGVPPLIAFFVLLFFWKSPQSTPVAQTAAPTKAPEPEPAAS